MRIVLDILAVLTLIGLLAGIALFHRERGRIDAAVERATDEVRRLELEVKYRAVTGNAELNELGWPLTVDPTWFKDGPPRNFLLTSRRPWIEIAGGEEADLTHPRVRIALDETIAGFWYNPQRGVVRARVPVMVSDEDTLALYNRVNGSVLRSIFDTACDAPKAETTAAAPARPLP